MQASILSDYEFFNKISFFYIKAASFSSPLLSTLILLYREKGHCISSTEKISLVFYILWIRYSDTN